MDSQQPPENPKPAPSEPYVPSLDPLIHRGAGPTPAQVAAEHARRKGRHRKEWWKDCPP